MEQEFSVKYIEMLKEEVNTAIQEKVILRAQIALLLDQYQKSEAAHQEREAELTKTLDEYRSQYERSLQDLENVKNQRENELLEQIRKLRDELTTPRKKKVTSD